MKRHKLGYFLFLFFIFFMSLLSFIPYSLSISHENDIDLTFMENELYNEVPYDFEYDNETLNPVNYNNSDYFEHVKNFDNEIYNYNDDYITEEINLMGGAIYDIVYYGIYYYMFSVSTQVGIYLCDNDFDVIYTISNPLYQLGYCDEVISVTTNGYYIYILGIDNIYDDYKVYVLNVLDDLNCSYVKRFTLENSVIYHPNSIYYYNNSIYSSSMTEAEEYYRVYQYDLDGNIINVYTSISGITNFSQVIGCYYNKFYLIDDNDHKVHVYDNSFNYITEYSKTINNVYNIYLYNDMFMVVFLDIYVYNLTIEVQDSYPIIRSYPDINGLFDSVDNLNVSIDFNIHRVGWYENSTYTFNNDDLNSNPNGWDITESALANVNVIYCKDVHKKIIEMSDTSASQTCYARNDFDDQVFGTIEYWYRLDSLSGYGRITQFWHDATELFRIEFDNTDFTVCSIDTGVDIVENTWYHIRIDFNSTSEIIDVYLNELLVAESYSYIHSGNVNEISFQTGGGAIVDIYIDSIGYSWEIDYEIGNNLIDYEYHNVLLFLDINGSEILKIDNVNGKYYFNNSYIDYDVFCSNGSYVLDIWSINLNFSQIYQNGTIYFYNSSNDLMFLYNFETNIDSNVKYINYVQYYEDSLYFINITNIEIYSNNTKIIGSSGYLSYALDLDLWDSDYSKLQINGYGRYRLWLFNDTYYENCSMVQLTNWFNVYDSIIIDIIYNDFLIENPYIIVESMNGIYIFDNIMIYIISQNCLLRDSRGFIYSGLYIGHNVNQTTSFFQIIDDKLYFELKCVSEEKEFMQMFFFIQHVDNEMYRILYDTYSNSTLEYSFCYVGYTDYSGSIQYIEYSHNYVSEVLPQDKTTRVIAYQITDYDLLSNGTISGYINSITLNYVDTLIIDVFIEHMLIGLVPIIIIFSLTFSLSYVFRKNEKDVINKSLFFPLFFIFSIIIFIFGFFDGWILYCIIIAMLSYFIYKSKMG